MIEQRAVSIRHRTNLVEESSEQIGMIRADSAPHVHSLHRRGDGTPNDGPSVTPTFGYGIWLPSCDTMKVNTVRQISAERQNGKVLYINFTCSSYESGMPAGASRNIRILCQRGAPALLNLQFDFTNVVEVVRRRGTAILYADSHRAKTLCALRNVRSRTLLRDLHPGVSLPEADPASPHSARKRTRGFRFHRHGLRLCFATTGH